MAEPVGFPEVNLMLKGGPPERFGVEVLDLPTHRHAGGIVSRWQLTPIERLQALVHGHVWVSVISTRTHPPIGLDFRPQIFHREGEPEPMQPFSTDADLLQARAILNDDAKTDLEKLAAIGVMLMKQAVDQDLAAKTGKPQQ